MDDQHPPGKPAPVPPDAPVDFFRRLQQAFSEVGFHHVSSTTVGAYDRAVPSTHRIHPEDSLTGPARALAESRLLVLVGNDRRAWPVFKAWLDSNPTRRGLAHPFDTWTVEAVRCALATLSGPTLRDLRFAFEGPPRAFAAQHLAAVTGLACRGPAALSVHPVVGPWFALRAALVFDVEGHPAPPVDDLCGRCEQKPCIPALDRALAAQRAPDTRTEIRERHAPWLAIRDACPVGREHRYSEPQIRWHYAHDQEALK